MGTNFYLLEKNEDYRENDPISRMIHPSHTMKHIGKSSSGWCFSLHVYPEDGIKSLEDWKTYMQEHSSLIIDEYKELISMENLLDRIETRSCDRSWEWLEEKISTSDSWIWNGYSSLEDFFTKNSAEEGPNNLLRHRIDGTHCIGHGEGTWDYIMGDFL